MQTTTEQQRQSLQDIIYSSLMTVKMYDEDGEVFEPGMGEMGEAQDEASRIIDEWMAKENIQLLDDQTPVRFLFEKDDTDTVFAYFPKMVHSGEHMTCYAHVGQHSACHPNYAENCKEATKTEYADLLRELIGQGYNNLTILNKDK